MKLSKSSSKRRAHPEDDLQRAVVRYLELQKPECIWFAVPNGGRRGKIEAARLKGLGVRPGVADLCFIWGSRKVLVSPFRQQGSRTITVLFVEMKAPRGRLSTAQEAFRAQCRAAHIDYQVVRSLDELQEVLRGWGLIR